MLDEFVNYQLNYLDLSDNILSEKSSQSLGTYLKGTNSLKKLILKSCILYAETAEETILALMENTSI